MPLQDATTTGGSDELHDNGAAIAVVAANVDDEDPCVIPASKLSSAFLRRQLQIIDEEEQRDAEARRKRSRN